MKGWLLDVYLSGEREISIWVKMKNGSTQIFKDEYKPVFYVHSSPKNLKQLEPKLEGKESIQNWDYEKRKVKLQNQEKKKVLKIECKSTEYIRYLAKHLEEFGNYKDYRFFNVDVPHSQKYFHENELFPLAKVQLNNITKPKFELLDSAESTNYDLPPLKYAKLQVRHESPDSTPSFNEPVGSILISFGEKEITLDEREEKSKILELLRIVNEEDPDVILTRGGDSWDIPYLIRRAKYNRISDRTILGRDPKPLKSNKGEGSSFFSYGRVYYRPPPHHLKGRIHIDTENSFIYKRCGLQGLIELSRITRTPLQKTARSSIGSAMTNLQLYWAEKNEVLIPWRKREPEDFKSAWKLIKSDRGGFIFEPRIGIHENVGEIDFSSFYPAMMEKHNISPETILCDCCPDSNLKVPELGYNMCKKRRGLIPQVLKPVLGKREKYKEKVEGTKKRELKNAYEKRQKALKWILVTCFGYLGYRNAKFGKIEAHEAVTAFARKHLQKASRIAEDENFKIIHGIVDSLWIKKTKDGKLNLEKLCKQIENEIKLPISPEGKYKWIVFPSSKENTNLPVTNRYYGVFENGEIKARGIMMRRRDTPPLIKKVQKEILKKLSNTKTSKKFKEKIPKALKIIRKYAKMLKNKKIETEKLALKKQISRNPKAYQKKSRSAIAAKQLIKAGAKIKAGQKIRFIVTKDNANNPKLRVTPFIPSNEKKNYDVDWYIQKLLDAAVELFTPFGYTREKIKSIALEDGKQKNLTQEI